MKQRGVPLGKDITFFYSNPVERETALPVADIARERGYRVSLTDEPFQKAEIGLYSQHHCFPANTRLSLVMLHDMAQGQLDWPNLWRREPWHRFDAGILPGETWTQRWRESCWHPYSRPRLGVFPLGWPKSDSALADREQDSLAAQTLRDNLGLQHNHTVLYAPAWENHNKQDEFVRSLMDLPVNLLLKQFPWDDQWPEMVRAVAEANAVHRNIADNVHVVDPDMSIMDCIELADVLVSEESSCLLEALLLGKPTISVTDWLIPDTVPARMPAAPFDVLIRTPKAGMRQSVTDLLADLPQHREQAAGLRDRNFCHLGESAQLIMNLVDALVETGQPPPELKAETPTQPLGRVPLGDMAHQQLRNAVYRTKHRLNIKQPLKATLAGALRRGRGAE